MTLLGCAAVGVVHAAGPPLSLRETKRIAFSNNWDLLAARADVDIAAAQRIVAREFPNPTLSLSTVQIDVDRGSGTVRGNGLWQRSYDTIAAVSQLFEIGGKRSARQQSAAAGTRAAEAKFRDARRLLDQAVTKAYVEVLLARTNVQILQRSAASLRKEADIAVARLKAGDISLADKSQIEMAADRLELDAKSAEAAAAAAKIALQVLVGARDPRAEWEPADSLETLASGTGAIREPAEAPVRPDFQAAEAAAQQARADLRLQKAMRVPDPTVLLQYEHEPPDQVNTVGVGVSFPLPLWNHNRGNIEAARARADQAALKMEQTRVQAAAEIASANISYRAALEKWQRQRDVIVPKSDKIRETVSFAYEKGGASLLDLLSAQRNDNDVRVAAAQAAADAANAAATLKTALNITEE